MLFAIIKKNPVKSYELWKEIINVQEKKTNSNIALHNFFVAHTPIHVHS
jgi:hypothetical protein